MPALATYRVFICHDWEYSFEYDRVVELLDSARLFSWENASIPCHDPVQTPRGLEYALRNEIREVDVLLVLAGMYAAYSEWMQFEMQFARRIGLPIIGIAPWGSRTLPVAVQRNANEIVGWSTHSIVDAIRFHCRR